MKGRTAAEEQIELLKQMKEARLKRKPAPLPAAPKAAVLSQGPSAAAQPLAVGAAPSGAAGGFELAEDASARPKARLRAQHALPVSKDVWKQLMLRQRGSREFRRRRDMGDWAAQLLLALPPGVQALSAQARAELFKRMREW